MLLESLTLGFIIGIVRNGRFSNISAIPFRGMLFLILGLVLQITPIFLGIFKVYQPYYALIAFLGVLCIFGSIIRNIEVKGFWIIALGALINVLVMAFNGYAMPIHLAGLENIGMKPLMDTIADGSVINYVSREGLNGVSYWFGKWIPIPYPAPLGRLISFGDIIMSIGIVWFVQAEMTSKRYLSQNGRMIRHTYMGR